MESRLKYCCDCQKYDGLGEQIKELNQMYIDRLQELDELDDHMELKAKLLYLWVADLVELNEYLVETIGDMEDMATEQVQILEEKLKKRDTSIQECVPQIKDPDGHTTVSLRAVVKRLEVDVASLLELIRRLRMEGSWDVKGLVFHEVSYSDLFGTEAPPQSVSRLEIPAKSVKSDVELNKLKMELQFWKNRVDTGETELKKELQKLKIELEFWKNRSETFEAEARSKELHLQKELDQTRKLTAGKELLMSSSRGLDTEVMLLQQTQLNEMLESAVGLEKTVTAAMDSLQQLLNKDWRQIVSVEKNLVADLRTVIGRFQQLSHSLTEELKSVDDQYPTQLPGTCMFDSEKMIAFQNNKVINLANYFRGIHLEVENVNKKLEECYPKETSATHIATSTPATATTTKSEDALIEDVVHSFTLALGQLMELAKEVSKLRKEITSGARRHRDIREKNLVNAVKAMQVHGLQHGELNIIGVPCICHSPERLKSSVELYEKTIRIQDNVIVRLQVIEETIRKKYNEAAKCSQMAGMMDTPIMLTSLLSSKLDATMKQANIQQEKINMLKQSISAVSQHMKYLRDDTCKDCHQWCTDSEVKVLHPVHCFSARTLDSEISASSLLSQHNDVAALKHELMECHKEVEDLPNKMAEISRKLERTETQMKTHEEIIAQLRRLCVDYECTIEHLENTIRNLGVAKEWQEGVVADEQRCWSLLKELEACEHEKKLLENNQNMIESQLANLQAQADSLSKETDVLKEQLCSSTAMIHQLEDSVHEWNKCREELKTVNMKQAMCVCELEVDKQNLSRQLDECKLEFCSVTAERNQLRQQLGPDQMNCSCATKDQEDVIEVCTSEKAVSTERSSLCGCKALSAEEENESLKSQALEELRTQLQVMAQQNANLQAEVQMLQRNNDRLALDLRLVQKAVEDTVSAASSSKKNYLKELEDMTTAYMKQEAVINRLSIQRNKLKAEVKALEKARMVIMERNAVLEKSNTSIFAELKNLKARLKQHEDKIELSEERWAMIDNQVRDCQQLVRLILEYVKGCGCTNSGDQVDTQNVGLQWQVRLYEDQQQKLLGMVGLLNNMEHAIQQKHGTTITDPLQPIVEKLQQDVTALSDQLSSANRKLQTSKCLEVNLTMEKAQREAEVKSLKDAYLKLKKESDSGRWELNEEVQALLGEREGLLQELREFQHANMQQCIEVEQLKCELQVYLPTRDSNYPHQMSDEGSSQQEWGN